MKTSVSVAGEGSAKEKKLEMEIEARITSKAKLRNKTFSPYTGHFIEVT